MDRFVTFVIGVLDGESHSIELLSAGHGPLVVYHAQKAETRMLPAHAVPLAVMDEVSFEAGDHIDLDEGDVVMLVTDGFFEWQNGTGEQFGMKRLAEGLKKHAGQPATTIIAEMVRDIREFSGGTGQEDDLTAVVIKRERSGS